MTSRDGERLARRGGLTAVVLVVAVTGAVGMELLGAFVREANAVRIALVEVSAAVNRQSALEWQAVATGGAEDEVWEALETNDAAIAEAADRLRPTAANDQELAGFLRVVEDYRAAVTSMTDFLRAGNVERAEATDEETVDPLFDRLHGTAHDLVAAYSSRADVVGLAGRVGTVGLLSGAAVAVGLLARRASAREAERRVEARFRALVHNASDLVTVISADGGILYEGPSVERLIGRERAAVVGQPYAARVHPDDVGLFNELVATARGSDGVDVSAVLRLAQADGEWRAFDTVARDLLADPDVGGIVLTARDITDRERLAERLRHQAAHDQLTGLLNRNSFLAATELALAASAPFAVLFLDLDDFKALNDNLGHGVGDAVLTKVAERVRHAVRPTDLAARLGGDEFAILVRDLDTDAGIVAVVTRLLDAVSTPIEIGATSFRLSGSVGVAVARSGGSPAELLSEADLAMYAAKRAGKGRFAFFEPSLRAASRERMDLQRELAGVVARHELVIHYQPIVSLHDGSVRSAEALVRWMHPRRGLVLPPAFIPLAEETGLIDGIGEWVLRQALEDVATWQRQLGRAIAVNVNISARQLLDAEFADLVRGVIASAGVPAESLTLEITESVFADPSDAVPRNLAELRGLGVKIAIDDFGTGYSALGYLPRLPVDILKIDRIFVAGAEDDDADPTLARSIVHMAHALGLETIAEGVETRAQLERMRDLGCQLAQGFVLSHPVPSEDLVKLLTAGFAALASPASPSPRVRALRRVS